MSAQAIFVSNLPRTITSAELIDQLLQKCPRVFVEPYEENTLSVEIYPGRATTAVIKGISYPYEKLKLLFRNIVIEKGGFSNKINVKPDYGGFRKEDGTLEENRSPMYRKNMRMLVGEYHRKVFGIIPNWLKDDLKREIFTAQNEQSFLNTVKINANLLHQYDGLQFIKYLRDQDRVALQFNSALEQLQALTYFNKNPNLKRDVIQLPPQFITRDGRIKCKYYENVGLGNEGQLISIYDFSMNIGYIPLTELHERFVDQDYIHNLSVKCWRCEDQYKILGLNLNFNSLAGKCSCLYATENGGPETIAYHWPDEYFTRLIVNGFKYDGEVGLCIGHHPIKIMYRTVQEYAKIIVPLIEEEWYFTSSEFKEANRTTGRLERSKFLENLLGHRRLYALKLLVVKRGDVWRSGNPQFVKKLIIKWSNQEVTSRLYKLTIVPNESNHVYAFVQVPLPQGMNIPNSNCDIEITPKLDKREYTSTRAAISKWRRQRYGENKMLDVVLNGKTVIQKDWRFEANAIPWRSEYSFSLKMRIDRVLNSLNTQQRRAVERATKNMVSFISGPPGTGKTRTLSALVLSLSFREDGGIVVCAPSNFAADGFAASLNTTNRQCAAHLPFKLLRIYSKSREDTSNFPLDFDALDFDVLHDKIKNHSLWSADPTIKTLIDLKDEGKSYFFTKEQKDLLKNHQKRIEKLVMAEYNIFVSTISALADKRVRSWVKDDKFFTTLVVDEAGQVTVPGLLNLFLFGINRMVFGGDPMQLPPTIMSFAAEVAGLSKSLLEICSWQIPREFLEETADVDDNSQIWTMLKVQHRMHPEICTIVSKFSYYNLLENADYVVSRPIPNHSNFLLDIFEGKRVGFLNHSHLETMGDWSYKNDGECRIIYMIIRRMLHEGIPPENITVLTLYNSQKTALKAIVNNDNVGIENVDGFQGRENSIIIVSLVRNNPEGKLGFLANQNRLNVAISRAMNFLIIAGCKSFYQSIKIQEWKTFMELVTSNATVIDNFMYE